MKFNKLKDGITLIARTIFAKKNVKMSLEEAVSYLHQVNPDAGSSCWVDNKLTNVSLGGGIHLSVILPAYNSEKWIRNAVDSVLSQKTEFNYELIIIDDGSNDNTAAIVDEYKNHKNVLVIHQENRGFSGARNSGIDIAKGKYLMFVDSDDMLLPDAIESLMKCAIQNNADVVCGNYVCSYANGDKKQGSNYHNEKIKPLGKLYGQPWGKVYKRELFKNLRYPVGYWFEDTIFAMIVWPQVNCCYTISQNVYSYFINESGISYQSKKYAKAIDGLYVTMALLKDKEKFGLQINNEDYNVYLRNVKLTARRTRRLDSKVQKAIFVVQCDLNSLYFSECKPNKENEKIANSLNKHNYKKYMWECLKGYF